MTAIQIIFFIAADVVLGAAVMVVSSDKMLHSAFWLIVSLFGVAALFALLQAGFFAVVQVVVYIGAIAILIIFAIMLTRRVMEDSGPQMVRWWWLGALGALGVYGILVVVLRSWSGFASPLVEIPAGGQDLIRGLGQALSSPEAFVLPFEVASILLLAALIGSIYIGWEKR
ncbi:MAG: NADH-quinone oxidoreductase subunit J [Chloroflexi bacterium]|nr:MAG: NADH-quinone oxidoreductase subunit J [Chloroflexota bacterium]